MSSMNQLPFPYTEQMVISVVGPTATGKTKYALELAEKLISQYQLPVVTLISADSRQVYQGLEIVSGADVPADFNQVVYPADVQFQPKNFFKNGAIELHGVSCIKPDEEWSLAHFQQFAHALIKDTWQRGGVPIIVGGTGLYHSRLFSNELQELAGPNQQLRQELSAKSITELQNSIQEKSNQRFEQMTVSDQQNKRRLIRVIEQLHGTTQDDQKSEYGLVQPKNYQTIGLMDSIEHIEQKIRRRVAKRMQQGAIQEVEQLLAEYATQPSLAIFSATGVKEIMAFLQEQISKEELEELWFLRERQYAKRQLTWWKKYKPLLAIPKTS